MNTTVRQRLAVTGVVQGVGFRPFVYSVATDLGLVGFVRNETTHVHIEVQGPSAEVECFERRLKLEAPPMARLDTVDIGDIPCLAEPNFRISASRPDPGDQPATLIPPDTAVCTDCLRELLDLTDRRYRHPFITCTNCGPRFTIITALPYDRPNTTMGQFALCDACAAEYADPTDRRHHAQPVACHDCGPRLQHERDGVVTSGTDASLANVLEDFEAGLIVAIKGIGGYHLALDATNGEAVQRLRQLKGRPHKPFAVMVADLDAAQRFASIDQAEAEALCSPARPIVLLRSRSDCGVDAGVTRGNPLIGIMLPSAPLHHLLFQPVPNHSAAVARVLVMTSGNIASEPICFDDGDARARLDHIADSFCTHDRPINVPCDDSVTRLLDGEGLPLRRSRGFAPLPVQLPAPVAPILAVGGEIKNTFSLATGRTAWISQHLGDMQNLETTLAFEASVDGFSTLYHVKPEALAVDAHPRYRTRRWAHANAEGRTVLEVQHHHAHLASLMAEHGLDGSQDVTGFVFDGTGYGTDGALWGGEILVGGYQEPERWGHLRPVQLPGGDSAIYHPCRTALAHLRAADVEWTEDLAPVIACEPAERRVIADQLAAGTNCVTSTSMGRLFDAVASLLGVRHRITYEAQAAIELEVLAAEATGPGPQLGFDLDDQGCIDPAPVFHGLVAGIRDGASRGALARGFHVALVEVMATCAQRIRDTRSVNVVGLTGGVFQNVLLAALAKDRLSAMRFEVLTHRLVPPNDGGLALGQLMVAAHQQQRRS